MPETLIDVHALRVRLADPQWVVLDCRFQLEDPQAGRRAYERGHVPGACHADLALDLAAPASPDGGRHPLPERMRWARTLAGWGIEPGVQVVAYDDQGGVYAARLWWMLRWVGHTAVAVLDGGWPTWVRAGAPISCVRPEARSAPICAWPEKPLAQVDTEAVAAWACDATDALVLVDARGARRYRGEEEPLDRLAGHVPGAINRPFSGNLDESGCFLAPARLRQRFQDLLERHTADQIIHMCGSGVSACHNILAMEHAGVAGSRLYVGSWSAWSGDPGRPVATGPRARGE